MLTAIFAEYQPTELINQQAKFIIQFEVKDVDEYYDLLKNKGIEFINKPHDRNDWGSRVAHFYDPDNNIIEIYKVNRG